METHFRLTLTGLGAIALLVSGCAGTTHYRNAVNTSYGQAEFDRDNYQCQRENQHQVVEAWGGMAEANDVVDHRMATACLAALGWRKVEQQPLQSQQPPPVAEPSVLTAADAYNLGVAAEGEKQPVQAMRWYLQAAEDRNANAQNNIGALYQNGRGVTQDYAEAMRWYRKAAFHANANAQNNIGALYQTGQGVTQDYAEAMRWYQRAAEQGNAFAQNNIGMLYQNGRGVTQDYAEATRWYQKAAEQGLAVAEKNLGVMYGYGWGVTQNYAEAMRWYRKAAKQGNAGAQNDIGGLYEGGHGVPQDDVQSLKWYILAASRYPDPASPGAKNRDALTLKMTPAQIAQAQGLAREWRPNEKSE